MLPIDLNTTTRSIIPSGELRLELALLPPRDRITDPALIHVYDAFAQAADIIVAEIVSGRCDIRPHAPADCDHIRIDAQAQHEVGGNEWVFGVANNGGRKANNWYPVLTKLEPAAHEAVSQCVDRISRIALINWNSGAGPLGINLNYKTDWSDLSNHQKIELQSRTRPVSA